MWFLFRVTLFVMCKIRKTGLQLSARRPGMWKEIGKAKRNINDHTLMK
jgi:hypothetical protein